ncbi:unnamed protein product [Didymodactylos carnosus]|uniref:XRCC4 N-terminal domain-containing protein n=1 Tax=Didymodactylos carnosus TaxID=1234261 RepID=A0A814MBV4_9BILA|nr:unnamed protein product [Didymodactylos carnosus]CAF1105954.1 unnamed protein product [Didymodactylos carnosus]CAF3843802.1 unnamed protein product [Didymodactylos carnosus]CAF3869361.1 unnamed protein product [Didymodactylos carnosus]
MSYDFTGGSLRLKGVSSIGKISKRKKKKDLTKIDHIASKSEQQHLQETGASTSSSTNTVRKEYRTQAEIAYQETMAKRLEEKILEKASKSHKQQVEELNSYLDKLTEYNDIPKGSIDQKSSAIDLILTNITYAWIGSIKRDYVQQLMNGCDDFYLHTKNAFNNDLTTSNYVYTCKKQVKNKQNMLTFTWKEHVGDNTYIIIGHMDLVQSAEPSIILCEMMDYNIQMANYLRKENEKKLKEIDLIKAEKLNALDRLSELVNIKKDTENELFRKVCI